MVDASLRAVVFMAVRVGSPERAIAPCTADSAHGWCCDSGDVLSVRWCRVSVSGHCDSRAPVAGGGGVGCRRHFIHRRSGGRGGGISARCTYRGGGNRGSRRICPFASRAAGSGVRGSAIRWRVGIGFVHSVDDQPVQLHGRHGRLRRGHVLVWIRNPCHTRMVRGTRNVRAAQRCNRRLGRRFFGIQLSPCPHIHGRCRFLHVGTVCGCVHVVGSARRCFPAVGWRVGFFTFCCRRDGNVVASFCPGRESLGGAQDALLPETGAARLGTS